MNSAPLRFGLVLPWFAMIPLSGCERAEDRVREPAATSTASADAAPPASADAQASRAPSESVAPARGWAPSDMAIQATSADRTYIARWEPEAGALPDSEPFNIRFAVRRADGSAIAADARFVVDAEMPHHGHGMNLVPTVARAGGWRDEELVLASGMLLHMPGRWVLSLDVEEDGVLERTQWFVDVE